MGCQSRATHRHTVRRPLEAIGDEATESRANKRVVQALAVGPSESFLAAVSSPDCTTRRRQLQNGPDLRNSQR